MKRLASGIARRRFLAASASAIVAPVLSRAARGQTADVVLRLHHFLSPLAYMHARFLVPWARNLEKEAGGRLRIDIFPSMQLGGAAPQLYDQARDGKADLIWTLPGLTPSRFPRIEVFDLPFVANRLAVHNTRAAQELFDASLKNEFGDVQVLSVFAQDRAVLHTGRPVGRMEDLKGLKLRTPTRLAGEALRALGSHSVTMPVPQVPDALQQRAIEGCLLSWEVAPAIKLHERLRFHADIVGLPTLSTTTFILAMNKARYAGLPADLRKIIDRFSGDVAGQMAARMWDDVAAAAKEAARSQGNTLTEIERGEAERWRRSTQPVVERWIKESKQHRFDGGALLEQARALMAKYGS